MPRKHAGSPMPNKLSHVVVTDNANTIIEDQLAKHLNELEQELEMDVLVYIGGIIRPADDLIRGALDSKNDGRTRGISVILETDGGYIEVAHRIADALRHHYRYVSF